MFTYKAYGLGIHSVLALPELAEQSTVADVRIQLGNVDQSRLEVVDADHQFWAMPREACHAFREVGAFGV